MRTDKRKFLFLFFLFHVCKAVVFLLSFSPFICFSQTSDTIDLREISVSPRYTNSLHKKKPNLTIDSLFIRTQSSMSIAQILQCDNSIYVKGYGASGSAVSSIRGGNSAQTAVLWNGFSIRNPMLGETDLSLFSVFLSDDVQIERGGSTAVWGNASVAGSIHLSNSPCFNQGTQISVNLSGGSFHHQSAGLKYSFGNNKLYSSTRYISTSSENDFYFTASDGTRKQMENNAFSRRALLQENAFLLKKNQVLTIRLWLQSQQRELPNSENVFDNKSTQSDEILRATVEYAKQAKKVKSLIRQAFFFDKLLYVDGASSLSTNSNASTSITEAEFSYRSSDNLLLQAGINNTYCSVVSDAYANSVFQNYLSLFGGISVSSKDHKNYFSFRSRTEHILNAIQPFTFSAEYRRRLNSNFDLLVNGNKLYRLPTLNDLYWNPGGNRSLLPEQGYSEEANLVYQNNRVRKTNQVHFSFSAGIFSRQMKNWIIWLPGTSGFWTPQNLLEVWSRGSETTTQIVYQKKDVQVKFQFSTQYILSTSQKQRVSGDQSVGKQLIYVPLYSGNATLQLKYKAFHLAFVQTYNGYRYTSSDNYQYLKPFSLANAIVGAQFQRGKLCYELNVNANNLFDISYQLVSARPMPGRNYLLTLAIQYKSKKQSNE